MNPEEEAAKRIAGIIKSGLFSDVIRFDDADFILFTATVKDKSLFKGKSLIEIKKALGVSGIMTKVSSWRAKTSDKNKKGTQIDLVIDRKDGYINICEMKFYKKEFTITREYYSRLEDRLDTFIEETKTRKAILLTFITSYGLTTNEYSDIVQKSLTLEDLFV